MIKSCYSILFFGLFFIIIVESSAQSKKQYYAVLIGISKYSRGDINLKFADSDAINMNKKLLAMNVPEENISLLCNEEASNYNIVSAMKKQFYKANLNDEIIFFFSGHGADGYFVAYDCPNFLLHSQLKSVFKASKAGTKIVFADACFSGTLKDGQTPKSIERDSSKNYLKGFDKKDKQIIVFASSRSNETSIENWKHRNGFFTYYLLRALSGYGDSNGDKIISYKELYNFVAINVKNDSKGKQSPNMFGNFDPDAMFVRVN